MIDFESKIPILVRRVRYFHQNPSIPEAVVPDNANDHFIVDRIVKLKRKGVGDPQIKMREEFSNSLVYDTPEHATLAIKKLNRMSSKLALSEKIKSK